jgi:hypothetical protein
VCCSAAVRHQRRNCGKGENSVIWGDVDRERRLKALLVAFVIVVGAVALMAAAVSAFG